MRKFSFIILILIFASISFAQTEAEISNKIALIDTDAFANKENGIKEIADIYDNLKIEFKPSFEELNVIAERIQKLGKELKALSDSSPISVPKGLTADTITRKIDEYESLVCKFKTKQSEVKSVYEKRRLEMSAEIDKKIENALKLFAEQNGYSIVLDSSKINPSEIILGETFDITKEFIQFYKEQFVKREAQ